MKRYHCTCQIALILILFYFTAHFTTTQAQDYTQFGLPEGAIARLGKGYFSDLVYSPDGNILAVAASIGVWLYDARTYKEIVLLTKWENPRFRTRTRGPGDIVVSGGWN